MYKNLIFDLDGTLWDASPAIAKAWTLVFKEFGFAQTVTPEDIQSVMGKPYLECLRIVTQKDSFDEKFLLKLNLEERKAIEKYKGSFYSGVEEGLKELHKHYQLFLVSNCKKWYLEVFLETNLGYLFKQTISYECFNSPKDKNISKILKENNLKTEETLYIGDTIGDRESSKVNSLDYFHVLYGGHKEPIGDMNFHSFRDLVTYFLKPQK